MGKAGLGNGNVDKYGAATEVAVGRAGALVDAAGSKMPEKNVYGDTKTVASSSKYGVPKNAATNSAMARLMQ